MEACKKGEVKTVVEQLEKQEVPTSHLNEDG